MVDFSISVAMWKWFQRNLRIVSGLYIYIFYFVFISFLLSENWKLMGISFFLHPFSSNVLECWRKLSNLWIGYSRKQLLLKKKCIKYPQKCAVWCTLRVGGVTGVYILKKKVQGFYCRRYRWVRDLNLECMWFQQDRTTARKILYLEPNFYVVLCLRSISHRVLTI